MITYCDKKWHGTAAERASAAMGKFACADKFFEYDTGNTYVTNGATWSLSPSMVAINALPTPTPKNINSAATTNSTNIKTTAGILYTLVASNISASIRYLKLYNKATAPIIGTDIPILTITLNPNSTTNIELGNLGYRFAFGIGLGITGAAIDTDTTAILASEVKVMTSYV